MPQVKNGLKTLLLSGALAGAPAANFPLFPAGNSLADQLKIVARMISVSAELGARRQLRRLPGGVGGGQQGVQHADVMAPVGERADDVRADEARTSGDEYQHALDRRGRRPPPDRVRPVRQ